MDAAESGSEETAGKVAGEDADGEKTSVEETSADNPDAETADAETADAETADADTAATEKSETSATIEPAAGDDDGTTVPLPTASRSENQEMLTPVRRTTAWRQDQSHRPERFAELRGFCDRVLTAEARSRRDPRADLARADHEHDEQVQVIEQTARGLQEALQRWQSAAGLIPDPVRPSAQADDLVLWLDRCHALGRQLSSSQIPEDAASRYQQAESFSARARPLLAQVPQQLRLAEVRRAQAVDTIAQVSWQRSVEDSRSTLRTEAQGLWDERHHPQDPALLPAWVAGLTPRPEPPFETALPVSIGMIGLWVISGIRREAPAVDRPQPQDSARGSVQVTTGAPGDGVRELEWGVAFEQPALSVPLVLDLAEHGGFSCNDPALMQTAVLDLVSLHPPGTVQVVGHDPKRSAAAFDFCSRLPGAERLLGTVAGDDASLAALLTELEHWVERGDNAGDDTPTVVAGTGAAAPSAAPDDKVRLRILVLSDLDDRFVAGPGRAELLLRVQRLTSIGPEAGLLVLAVTESARPALSAMPWLAASELDPDQATALDLPVRQGAPGPGPTEHLDFGWSISSHPSPPFEWWQELTD